METQNICQVTSLSAITDKTNVIVEEDGNLRKANLQDTLISKLQQEINELNDKLTNKTTWKYLGEATNGNKLTLPNPDKYEELLIVASSSNVDNYCKYTFHLPRFLMENFYTGSVEYLKEGFYANEYYYGEIVVEFSNSKNGNYVKLNAVHYKGNDIGGAIHVCYR